MAVHGKDEEMAAHGKDDDILESVSGLLFGEPQFAHGAECCKVAFGEQSFSLVLADTTETKLMSHYVWNSAIALSWMILNGKVDMFNKKVLEFGAGSGLVSLAAQRAGSCLSVATDYDDPAIIHALCTNLDAIPGARVVPHIWGQNLEQLRSASFGAVVDENAKSLAADVILCADTLWMAQEHDNLLDSIMGISNSHSQVWISCGLHTGKHAISSFLEKAKYRGLRVSQEWTLAVPSCLSSSGDFIDGDTWANEYAKHKRNPKFDGFSDDIDHIERKKWIFVFLLCYSRGSF